MRSIRDIFRPRPRVSVIRLQGIIAAGARGSLSDHALAPIIERAFRRGKPRAVALVINSPGGSPVQSALIAARIRRLADERKIPVHAFVEDVAASGGYWLATAADDIWLDANSVTGSIGVISSSFGFPEFLARHGIERRVHTAGASKSFLDPFSPEKPEDVARLQAILEPIHDAFKAQVASRRGARLREGRDLFTGDIWVGQGAVDVGLADGIAHVVPKLKSIYGDKVKLIPYGVKRSIFQRFTGQIVGSVLDAAEERALWSRYGL
ncbi:S49 family peptidase [Defluviimonas sp. WL0002]|uniref:S49 family peptidase n=1 Tax=Albidovulum marisflavi TaxID=2984159 RepID=A0ABT2Z927_9RHOB|nr:S49 family peptidase [Defluviimonas sp. WL0002]MCV2867532.1 S49 family peptidase [Defluviimonas sp. WL0002]